MSDPLRPARQEILAEKGMVDEDAVDLASENQEAAEIFMLTRNQVIMAGSGQPVDINLVAVKAAMDACGVVNQRDCLQRVVTLWRHFDAERQQQAGT